MNINWQIIKLVFYVLCFLAIAIASYLIYMGRYDVAFKILAIALVALFIDIIVILIKRIK